MSSRQSDKINKVTAERLNSEYQYLQDFNSNRISKEQYLDAIETLDAKESLLKSIFSIYLNGIERFR